MKNPRKSVKLNCSDLNPLVRPILFPVAARASDGLWLESAVLHYKNVMLNSLTLLGLPRKSDPPKLAGNFS